MSNKDYENKNRELQPYHGFLDNKGFEESGNVSDDSEDITEESGNVIDEGSEDSFSQTTYESKAENLYKEKEQNIKGKNKNDDTLFFIFLITVIIGSYWGGAYFNKKAHEMSVKEKNVSKNTTKASETNKLSNKKQNIKDIYINDLNNMSESELIVVATDYLKNKRFIFDKKYNFPCSWFEVKDKFFNIIFKKKYRNLLDVFLTKYKQNKSLYMDTEFYNLARLTYNNTPDFLDVFVKQGINIKKIKNLIYDAISNKDLQTVKLCLDNGFSIDERNDSSSTPLFSAISKNNYEIADYLIKMGALSDKRLEEYNKYGNLLYFPLIQFNNYEMVNLLVNNGVLVKEDLKLYTNDRKILRFIDSKGKFNLDEEVYPEEKEWKEAYDCIRNGRLDELIKLEKKGIDLSKMYYDKEPAVCIAVKFNRLNIVEYLIKKYDCRKLVDLINGRNALHYSAMDSSAFYILKLLLENGFDPNELDYENNTPLNLSCLNQPSINLGSIVTLLSKGANPNLLNKKKQNSLFFMINDDNIIKLKHLVKNGANMNQQDIYGNTPLHNYLLNSTKNGRGYYDFLRTGAKINLVNLKKQTPLHLAVYTNNFNAVETLLNARSDINQQDIDGNTALHYIAKYAPFDKMLEAISEYKHLGDFTIKNNEGKTPLDIVEPNCFSQSGYLKK